MEDEQFWDQVAIMKKEIDGHVFVATVVASKQNEFEVITTMEEKRIVIAVPVSLLVDIGNHVRGNLTDKEIDALENATREIRKSSIKNTVIPIGDFVKNYSDRISDETFAPMKILMDRCKFLFDDHFNFSHGEN